MVDTSRTRLRRSDEKSRRLPSLEVSRIAENPQITRMLMQVKEILERRFGPTAPIFERAVTWGELFERGVVDIRDETGVLARTKDKVNDLALRVNGETIEPESIGMNALNFDVTVAAKNEGTEITGYMLTIDFVGSGVTASASGSDVTVTINGPAAASESAAGIAEIATQAEVDGGTDDARFVTPLKLANWAGGGGGGGGGGGAGAGSSCLMRRAASQSFTGGAHTAVQWDTTVYDPDGYWSGTNPSRFTVANAGRYLVTASARMNTGTSVTLALGVRVNGTTTWGNPSSGGTAVDSPGASVSQILDLAAGDYVEVMVYVSATVAQLPDSGSPVIRYLTGAISLMEASPGVSLSAVNVFTKNQSVAPYDLTYAATIAVDASQSNIFRVTLAGNPAISNPTNLTDGMVLHFILKQDTIGSRSITWGDAYRFGAAGPPSLSTQGGYWDVVSFMYDGPTQMLSLLRAVTGFSMPLTEDAYIAYVVALIHGDGPNASTNIVDSGPFNRVLTANGNAQISTAQSKFGGAALAFDGAGDSVTMADSQDFDFSSGDWTIEGWFYGTSFPSDYNCIVNKDGQNGVTSWQWGVHVTSAAKLGAVVGPGNSAGAEQYLTGATSVTVNAWHHLAFAKSGTTLRLFLDGALEASATLSATIADGSYPVSVGMQNGGARYWNGYIEDIRITKGIARYVASFALPGIPFTEKTQDSAKDVLLLHMKGAAGSTAIIDQFGHAGGVTGTAALSSAQAKFWPTSFAPGNSSWISTGTGDQVSGTQDFTFEAWCYATSNTGFLRLAETSPYDSGTLGWLLYLNTNMVMQLSNAGGGGATAASNTAFPLNQWVHVAFVRSGNLGYLYINGTRQTATLNLSGKNFAANAMCLGSTIGTRTNNWAGYIGETRYSIGIARYTAASFVVPTAPFLNYDSYWATVVAHLHFDGPNASTVFLDQKGHKFTAVGNAQISTAQSKFDASSYLGDGTGDAITAPDSTDWDFGSGDFTIEAYVRCANLSASMGVASKRANTSAFGPFLCYVEVTTGKVGFQCSANGSSYGVNLLTTTVLSATTWYHLAWVRSGSTFTIYINGTAAASGTMAGALVSNASALALCAGAADGGLSFNGHIDELRITKGVARYTANFTPLAAPFAHN